QSPPTQSPPTQSPPRTWPKDLSPTSLPPKLRAAARRPPSATSLKRGQKQRPGKRLLSFDRRIGARFVAGADEAGRGSLAGPLVVAGVLLDYGRLRDHRVRPLARLNDSKQVAPERRGGALSSLATRASRHP